MNGTESAKEQAGFPNVTVLMAAYNEERFIREAIESILNQTYQDFEFLIINDGSTDGTRDILLSYNDPRILVVDNEENLGLTRSLNRGLALARGEYIARQDANDISHPDRLKLQIAFLERNPEVAVLGTQMNFIDIKGRNKKGWARRKPLTRLGTKYAIIFNVPVNHATVVYSRKIIREEFNGYDPDYIVGQDGELWCRVGVNHTIMNLPQALVDVRIDPSSVSGDINHPRRTNHYNRWRKRLPLAMREILGINDIPGNVGEQWIDLHDPNRSIDGASILKFLRAVNTIEKMFCVAYPEAIQNKEIKEITADVRVFTAFYLVEHSRKISMYIYFKTILSCPGVAIYYLPKYVALLIMGQYAKIVMEKCRSLGKTRILT
jgi:glycosyltransferase involved in cell wall biosynthesis